MRVGVISDIHGNRFGLEPVLGDLERQGVDQIVCLGDICFGPQAHECLAIVRDLGCPVVLGNWDAWSKDGFPPADDPLGAMLYEIGAWWAGLLTPEDHEFVSTFIPTLDVDLGDDTIMHCYHGSPKSFSDWIFSTTPDADLEPLFDGVEAPILVGGHTHLQMMRRFGRQMIVNPGSVGQPFSQWWPKTIRVAPWAEYAIIEAGNGSGDLHVDLRRVPIDVDALLRFCLESGMPHAQWWVDSWNPA
jgi:predicted phosphodiesterase